MWNSELLYYNELANILLGAVKDENFAKRTEVFKILVDLME